MLLGVLTLAWKRRNVDGAEFFTSLTAAFAVLFVFLPGAGPQYLVWIAPFLAWSLPRWYLAVTLCSSVYMFAFYQSTELKHAFPWELSFPKGPEIAVWGPWMNVAWGAFILLLVTQARRWWQPAPWPPSASGRLEAAARPCCPS